MIRRSFNGRFAVKVLNREKTTTIRDKEWPVDVPIMGFTWSGKPYRSKQQEIAPIIVKETAPIDMWIKKGHLKFFTPMSLHTPLWKSEGFSGWSELEEWFCPLVKPNQVITKFLHRFEIYYP